jgi:hypothetical protein
VPSPPGERARSAKHVTATTILLTGAGGSAAANVLDALRRADRGYRVVSADASAVRLHLSEADQRYLLPRCDDPGYASALRRLIEATGAVVLHAQPDPEVAAIGSIRGSAAGRHLPSEPTSHRRRFRQGSACGRLAPRRSRSSGIDRLRRPRLGPGADGVAPRASRTRLGASSHPRRSVGIAAVQSGEQALVLVQAPSRER